VILNWTKATKEELENTVLEEEAKKLFAKANALGIVHFTEYLIRL
jgi:hypothetical protein